MQYRKPDYPNFIEICDQNKLDVMLKDCSNFNDAVLKSVIYTSGSFRSDNNSLYPIDDLAEVIMIFESQAKSGMKITLIFDQIIQFNLVPSNINYDSLFNNPFFYIDDNGILFSKNVPLIEINEENSKDNTWIKSKSLRYLIESY